MLFALSSFDCMAILREFGFGGPSFLIAIALSQARSMKAFLTVILIMTTWSVAQSQPMKFFAAENGGTCQDNCSWIAAEGDITSDTPAAFRKYLKESFHYPYLHINSQGG